MRVAKKIATGVASFLATNGARLCLDRRGSIAVFLGLAIIPLVGAIGIGVDTARGFLVRSRLSQALDSAALAGGRVMFENYRDQDVAMYFTSNFPNGYLGATVGTPVITDDGAAKEYLTVTAEATLPSTFMRIFGQQTITVRASATINRVNRGMELALVLDNTGSMSGSGKMTALKSASTDLLNILYGDNDTANNLYVSLVPFVAMVNIGEQYSSWTTPKPTGQVQITSLIRTSSTPINSSTTLSSSNPATYFACATTASNHGFQNGILVDISGATQAAYNGRRQIRTTEWPSGCSQAANRFWYVIDNGYPTSTPTSPATGTISVQRPPEAFAAGTGHTQSNGRWKGCVEARADPYDLTQADASPTTAPFYKAFYPSTHPLKWYDNSSTKRLRATCSGASSTNSDNNSCDNDWVLGSAINEDGGSLDVGSYGPNKGCPVPVMPLQPSKATALAAVNNMTPWYGGGTSIPTGLSWGWRVLSPNYQGLWASPSLSTLPGPYNQALVDKVVVLLSDGMNEVVDHGAPGCQDSNTTDTSYYQGNYACAPPESDYTAYGRLTEGRMGGTTITSATTGLNSKISSICAAMKQQNIIIYTIILQVNDATIQNVFQQCATKPEYSFVSPTASDLSAIFKKIANQLSNLRLSQ